MACAPPSDCCYRILIEFPREGPLYDNPRLKSLLRNGVMLLLEWQLILQGWVLRGGVEPCWRNDRASCNPSRLHSQEFLLQCEREWAMIYPGWAQCLRRDLWDSDASFSRAPWFLNRMYDEPSRLDTLGFLRMNHAHPLSLCSIGWT